ncbi:MAG: DsrE family protein [Desulfohalobiaceae bacterium]|nr:DsrE family protein [Desulfohalobiaceae bacterium]
MSRTLGLCVTSDKHLDYVIGLASAAADKDVDLRIFFTGKSVLLTQEERFKNLVGLGKLFVCDVSFRTNGLEGKEVPGVGFKEFVTQARNAEMIEECDRYLVM